MIFPGFLRPTAIFTYFPSTSGSCPDSYNTNHIATNISSLRKPSHCKSKSTANSSLRKQCLHTQATCSNDTMARKHSTQSRKTPAAKCTCTTKARECPGARGLQLEKQHTTQIAIRSQEMPVESSQRRSAQRVRQVCCQKADLKGSLRTLHAPVN